MKKQTVSFQFDTTPAPFRPLRPTDAAAGVLLLAGIWGLLWQCLRPESVPGLLGLGALAALGLALRGVWFFALGAVCLLAAWRVYAQREGRAGGTPSPEGRNPCRNHRKPPA